MTGMLCRIDTVTARNEYIKIFRICTVIINSQTPLFHQGCVVMQI